MSWGFTRTGSDSGSTPLLPRCTTKVFGFVFGLILPAAGVFFFGAAFSTALLNQFCFGFSVVVFKDCFLDGFSGLKSSSESSSFSLSSLSTSASLADEDSALDSSSLGLKSSSESSSFSLMSSSLSSSDSSLYFLTTFFLDRLPDLALSSASSLNFLASFSHGAGLKKGKGN